MFKPKASRACHGGGCDSDSEPGPCARGLAAVDVEAQRELVAELELTPRSVKPLDHWHWHEPSKMQELFRNRTGVLLACTVPWYMSTGASAVYNT